MASDIPADIVTVPIDSLCEFIVDCLHETPEISDEPTGYYMARTSDIRNGRISIDTSRYVSEEVYQRRIQRGTPLEGDIIISREAPLGEIGRMPADVNLCLGQRLIHYRPDANKVNPRYLLYALLSPCVQAEFHANRGVGSVVDNLRMHIARSLPIPLPRRRDQDFIADILGSLDDKIELNRQMNATLEAMARALFQSWFIDFDPVRAKAAGESPVGMDTETAALFPDSFEDSELGPIPQGWRVMTIPEAIEINPTRPLAKGRIAPYLAMENMPTASARVTEWDQREFGSGMRFKNGDVLFARITPCLENGKTAFVDFLDEGEIGWGSTEYIVLHSKPGLLPEFAYFLARTDELRDYAIQNMTGTSGRQRVPPSAFDSYRLAIPPEPIAAVFGTFARNTLLQMKALDEEARTLAQLRDSLLPKLISGEVKMYELRVQQ